MQTPKSAAGRVNGPHDELPPAISKADDQNRNVARSGSTLQPLTEDADELATDLRCSRRHLEEMDRDGRLGPRAIRLGRRRVWNRAEIQRWIEAGAPDRLAWSAMRGGQR